MTSENYDDPAVESLWLQEQRNHVIEYLMNEEVSCDELAKSPAWFVAPYVSIWTVVPKTSNGRRLWVICGDLPADYIESSKVIDVREAMRTFASRWRELSRCMMQGEQHPTLNIGRPEDRQELGGLLQKRAGMLQRWADDDSFWSFVKRPIRLPPEPVLRAYVDLLAHTFVFLRYVALAKGVEPRELFDLAEALHNVPNILLDYDRWIDEARFREEYLRPFDRKWAKKAFSLEKFVLERIDFYKEAPLYRRPLDCFFTDH